MKKQIRFHIGDYVSWPGGPNEFRNNRFGYIVKIKKNNAYISDNRYSDENKLREVPLKILILIKKK